MDDAEADLLWYAGPLVRNISQGRVGGRRARDEAFGVSLRAIVQPSADLGGSSDYSVETTED